MVTAPFVYLQDVRAIDPQPDRSILSKTIQNDERSKVIVFSFAAGQELSAHTAPFPATIYIAKGEATLKLGEEEREATEGTFAYMTANLVHGIQARTDVVMILTMLKNPAPKG
jgi:quercetin dioxygenase-like cupin family protein